MQNKNSIIKDFFYSAFIAILPTGIYILVHESIFGAPSSIDYGYWLLFSFLGTTLIIFLIRRLFPRKVWIKMCFILYSSMFAIIVLLDYINGPIICNQAGGDYSSTSFTIPGVYDIDGEYHIGRENNRPDYVCYITTEQLEKINPKANFYKYVDFVIEN